MVNTREQQWKRLSDEVDRRGGDGAEFVKAMKEQYALFDNSVVVWLAKLYDPDIGGFYFSNSARDTECAEYKGVTYKLLPDIESTNQAVGFLELVGFLEEDEYSRLPEEMKAKIADFVRLLEDPDDGYFYHPQWGKNITDNRRGRDLMWAESLSKTIGFDLKYPTATERLAKVIEKLRCGENVDYDIPEHLSSKEAFIKYLDSFDWSKNAYFAGNKIAAQTDLIKAVGLDGVCVEYLNKIQNPETGFWGDGVDYAAINGHMKISCFYEFSGNVIPRADKAVDSILKCILDDTDVETVCWQFNAWFSIRNVLANLRKFGGEEGAALADTISAKAIKQGPESIRANIRKVAKFKKPDGSCSYLRNETSVTSQGAFVALPGSNEGDINATTINIMGVINRMHQAMDLGAFRVPLFTDEDYELFLNSLKKTKK